MLRELVGHPVYVIETTMEAMASKTQWGSSAYIVESIAKNSFFSAFSCLTRVEENPPMNLVRMKAQHRMDRVSSPFKFSETEI